MSYCRTCFSTYPTLHTVLHMHYGIPGTAEHVSGADSQPSGLEQRRPLTVADVGCLAEWIYISNRRILASRYHGKEGHPHTNLLRSLLTSTSEPIFTTSFHFNDVHTLEYIICKTPSFSREHVYWHCASLIWEFFVGTTCTQTFFRSLPLPSRVLRSARFLRRPSQARIAP
jgi:hypothetical protein